MRLPYCFYHLIGDYSDFNAELPSCYSWHVWRPSLRAPWFRAKSNLRTKLRFAFRTAVHVLGLFATQECGAICVVQEGSLVHYSGFTPRYWRFRFIVGEDMQIGDTWTDPSQRGKGIAFFALQQILRIERSPGRSFWYVVGESNLPSIRVVKKAGFSLVAKGRWVRPLGIKLFGSYMMEEERGVEQLESVAGAAQPSLSQAVTIPPDP